MKQLKVFLYVLLSLLVIYIFSDIFRNKYITIAGFTQGTTYSIKVVNTFSVKRLFIDEKAQLVDLVDKGLKRFDTSLNAYVDYSIISRLNRNEQFEIDDAYFKTCFLAARQVYDETDGAFDITGGPLYSAWGFGPGKKNRLDKSGIDSVLAFVGMDKIRYENNMIIKADPRIQLNVNAIAQGYSVDVIADLLHKNGYHQFIVEIGGELRTAGRKWRNQSWRVGVDKPLDNAKSGEQLQIIIQLENKALATSGNYRKFYIEKGVKYAHSIDPVTGFPVRRKLLSASVIADNCMFADAYATAFMVKGLDWTKAFLKSHSELEAYLIYSDDTGLFKEFYTEGFKKLVLSEN